MIDLQHPPAVYLRLFHGRADPDAGMDDWGEEGPTLGPLRYVHGTYATDLKFRFLDLATAQAQGFDHVDGHLSYHKDLLVHGDRYYGDFAVSPLPPA